MHCPEKNGRSDDRRPREICPHERLENISAEKCFLKSRSGSEHDERDQQSCCNRTGRSLGIKPERQSAADHADARPKKEWLLGTAVSSLLVAVFMASAFHLLRFGVGV